jgi:hypothetical protein
MDYLKAFTIGTSSLVWFHHMALLALTKEENYNFSFKAYSILAPLYYGLMTMFALYLGKTFGWSLRKRLFITSIISIIFVAFLTYINKSYNLGPKETAKYLINHVLRHLIAFNLIIYYIYEYFSKYWLLKVFVIGSSFFSYFITYPKVLWLDYKDKINYDYKFFAVQEPFTQGSDLTISLYILCKILGFDLQSSLLIWNLVSSVLQLFLAYNLQTYHFSTVEWIRYFIRIILTGFVKIVPFYYLLKNLK